MVVERHAAGRQPAAADRQGADGAVVELARAHRDQSGRTTLRANGVRHARVTEAVATDGNRGRRASGSEWRLQEIVDARGVEQDLVAALEFGQESRAKDAAVDLAGAGLDVLARRVPGELAHRLDVLRT